MTYLTSLDSNPDIAINGPWLILNKCTQFVTHDRVLVQGRYVYRLGKSQVVYGVGDVAFTIYNN